MQRAARWLSLASLSALAFACSAQPASGRRGGAGGSGSAGGGSSHVDGGLAGAQDAGGFGNGSGNHAGAGGTGTPAADGGKSCGSVSVAAKRDVHPGNMLVVFDQSLTMGDAWTDASGQNAPKYSVAAKALETAVTPIADKLNAGAIFLPTTAATGLDICTAAVAPISMPPQIMISPSAQFLPLWQQHFAVNPLLLGTPLNKALKEADSALMPAPTGTTVVVIFTDGQWTCEDGSEATTVASLLTRNIKTYVVGLPGALGATGLDNLAKAGGTATAGCSSNCFLLPTDAAKLQDALSMIAQEALGFDTCSFTIAGMLTDEKRACTTGSVKVNDQPVPCDAKNGFSVDDATHLSFHGSACDTLKTSGATLAAKFPCDVVVPQ